MMKNRCKAVPSLIMKMRVHFMAVMMIIFLLEWQPAIATQAKSVEDWVRQCEDAGEFSGRCFVRQSLTLKSTGKMLFEIAAGYPLGGDYPLLLLSTPLGTYLPPGINLEVDQTGAYRAVLAYCNTDGCHAYYRMTQELYQMFRSGRWLNVSFVDGTRRVHRFQVSLNGFSTAIDSVSGR